MLYLEKEQNILLLFDNLELRIFAGENVLSNADHYTPNVFSKVKDMFVLLKMKNKA